MNKKVGRERETSEESKETEEGREEAGWKRKEGERVRIGKM